MAQNQTYQEELNERSMRKRSTEPKTRPLRFYKNDNEFTYIIRRREKCTGLRGLAVRDFNS